MGVAMVIQLLSCATHNQYEEKVDIQLHTAMDYLTHMNELAERSCFIFQITHNARNGSLFRYIGCRAHGSGDIINISAQILLT